MFRMKPVRSSRRIAQTPNWQVNDEMTRITVRINANHGSAWRLNVLGQAGSWRRAAARSGRRPGR